MISQEDQARLDAFWRHRDQTWRELLLKQQSRIDKWFAFSFVASATTLFLLWRTTRMQP